MVWSCAVIIWSVRNFGIGCSHVKPELRWYKKYKSSQLMQERHRSGHSDEMTPDCSVVPRLRLLPEGAFIASPLREEKVRHVVLSWDLMDAAALQTLR